MKEPLLAPPSMDYERKEIVQLRGPTVSFYGKLLAEEIYELRDQRTMLMQIWETPQRNYIAISESRFSDGKPGVVDSRVAIVQRTNPDWMRDATGLDSLALTPESDELRMRLEVMAHFAWEHRARTLARKLKWNIGIEVA